MFRTLLIGFAAVVVAKKKKKVCEGMFDKEGLVKNICHNTFPKDTDDKIWLIKFYTPYGRSKSFQPEYEQLAVDIADNDNIAVAAIDCSKGKNVDFCKGAPYTVGASFPSIMALHKGKLTKYRKKADKEAVKTFILDLQKKIGSKGGSAKCPKGEFTSTVKDPVVPLCTEHFPSEDSKNSWIIAFYSASFDTKVIKRVALDLGNEPVEKSKQLKKVMAQRKRLKNLKDKYDDLPIVLPKKGELSTTEPLAKMGAVCCHCDDGKYKTFCEEKVGSGEFDGQKYLFINGATNAMLEGDSDAEKLVSQVLEQLGHFKTEKSEL